MQPLWSASRASVQRICGSACDHLAAATGISNCAASRHSLSRVRFGGSQNHFKVDWWEKCCGDAHYPRLSKSYEDWVDWIEERVGGKLVYVAGSEYMSETYWWGNHRKRLSRHEGVDLCNIVKDGRDDRIPIGFEIPPTASGTIVSIFNDFMAQSIVIKHAEELDGFMFSDAAADMTDESWFLFTLLSHIELHHTVKIGDHVTAQFSEGSKHVDLIASLPASKTTAPPHIHVSLLAAPKSLSWEPISRLGYPMLHEISQAKRIAFVPPPIPTDR